MSATAFHAEVGPIITGGDLEQSIIATLRAWLPGYLCQAEEQHGLEIGATPIPRGWAITGRDLQKLNSDQLPCIVILAGGIVQPPAKESGLGAYTATWGVEIGTVFNAAWGHSARAHAQLYAAAIRVLMTQRPLEQLPPALVDWRGEAYDEMDFGGSRSYSASICSFNVQVREVSWAHGGPPPSATPPADPTSPWDEWVQVTDPSVTVTNTSH